MTNVRAIDLIDYVNNYIDYTFYINEFPAVSRDDCAFIRMTGGFPASEWTSVKKPSFQVVVRHNEKGAQYAEQKAYEIFEFFHNRQAFTLDEAELGDSYYLGMNLEVPQSLRSIVHCRAEQSTPMYLGRDENNRPIYSMNFTLVTK